MEKLSNEEILENEVLQRGGNIYERQILKKNHTRNEDKLERTQEFVNIKDNALKETEDGKEKIF